jgi:hypothetical protein
MGIISQRLKKQVTKFNTQKLVNISDFYKAKQQAEINKESIKTLNQLNDLHPVHAVYVSAQNLVSFLAENLSELPELKEYCDIVGKAEDEYMPDGPPFSPLTRTYFTTWAFFDVQFGKDKETIGTCLQDIGSDLAIHSDYLKLIKLMQGSKMGIYEHKGFDNEYVYLSELITNKEYKCIVPAGYMGRKNELWFIRLLPPPFNLAAESVVFTTPYVLISHNRREWIKFIERSLPKTKVIEPILAYETFMKYGLNKNYWNEFIFCGYTNSTPNVIFLAGLPDKPETLPHSGYYRGY